MSRAYCPRCNNQVTATPAGTCPDGHALPGGDGGPAPWVGRVDETTDAFAPADLQELHVVGVGARTVNGNGHGPHPVERQRANSQASDDLAAMLAEALRAPEPDAEEPTADPEPVAPAPSPTTTPAVAAPEEDWEDLATLAAELQLDTGRPDDVAPPAPAPAPVDEIWATPADDQPDVATASVEDLPSPAPAAGPADEIPPPADQAEAGPDGPSVDLTNFTARGARVGATGRTSSRRFFGRKR